MAGWINLPVVNEIQAGSGWTIKPASWRDLRAVRTLEKISFPRDSWPLLDMIAALTLGSTVRFKLEKEGELVGFVVGDIRRFRSTGWIATIAVHPDYRGQGFGRALLKVVEEAMQMPRVRLSVRPSNTVAVRMYEQLGYQQIGRWARYYVGGEDALVMEKIIAERD
jgi:ribosomal-protein-alanine acetyltransferase